MPVSLHTHSWYSLLEGVSGLSCLLDHAKRGGHETLALTDTNNLYGVVSFIELATRAGIRPIIGACLKHAGQRAIALVADHAGYRNLCRIISRIQLAEVAAFDGHAENPGSLVDILIPHAEGLHLLVDHVSLMEQLAAVFRGRLWLEVIRPGHPSREEKLLDAARRLGVLPVASTAAHFTTAKDYPTFRLVTAVRQNTLLDRLPETLTVTPEHRFLSVSEFHERFRDLPEAITNGEILAGLLRSDVLPRELILPKPKLTRPLDLVQYLHALCERGLRERGMGADLSARERLRQELIIIEANDFAGYFLTVRDITREVRKRGHTMALRGSAGNSLVCYLLGITEVDPLRFGLEMERFLHPGRTDLPDIDLDFDWKVRDEIIDYVFKRYGSAYVARISAHQFLQPRSAFRDAGKIHGLSNEQISELLTHLDERVDEMLLPDVRPGERLPVPRTPRVFPLEEQRWPRIVRDARRLLGRPMHLSLHPGGVIITPQPVDGYVPIQWAAKGVIMTQFEKDAIEYTGLVKIDLLGNRALATVDEARRHSQAPIPSAVRSDGDPTTLALFRTGQTLGITQMESPAMRHLLLQMQPRGLEDVIQSLALLRPGAASIGMKECFIRRRRGLEPTVVYHPALRSLLGETHGLMLYEDDALRLIQALTGLPAADADRFRKRISKHKTEEEAEGLRREFLVLCARQGIPAEALSEIWIQLAKFNRYSFCKSHSVSYGLIAWQAAYLKAHHPLAFWTAALNNNMGAYPRRVYVEAIKRAGIEMRLPCVNHSRYFFTPEERAIRTGLEAIAGVPEEVKANIVEQRDRDGPYRDLGDFRRRVPIGPEALGTLIRAGALDFTGRSRPALYLEARLQEKAGLTEAKRPSGELFALDLTDGWSPPEDDSHPAWRDQWETLGFVLGPPLFRLFRTPPNLPRGVQLITSEELPRYRGRLICVEGIVATARHVFTEDGRPVQFVTLEDEHGFVEVTIFAGNCDPVPYLTMGPYTAMGVVEDRHGAVALTARRFWK